MGILFGGAGMAWNEMGEVPGIVLGSGLSGPADVYGGSPRSGALPVPEWWERGCEAGGRHCGGSWDMEPAARGYWRDCALAPCGPFVRMVQRGLWGEGSVI